MRGVTAFAAELGHDIVHFPLWWYTTGVRVTASSLVRSAGYYARSLGIGVWLRNIFVPMYGQYDWRSRVISLFVRTMQIIFRGIALGIWCLVLLCAFVVYLVTPIVATVLMLYHITGGFLGMYG